MKFTSIKSHQTCHGKRYINDNPERNECEKINFINDSPERQEVFISIKDEKKCIIALKNPNNNAYSYHEIFSDIKEKLHIIN